MNQEGVVAGLIDNRVTSRLADNVGFLCLLPAGKADGVFEEQVKPFIKGDATMLMALQNRLGDVFAFSRGEI